MKYVMGMIGLLLIFSCGQKGAEPGSKVETGPASPAPGADKELEKRLGELTSGRWANEEYSFDFQKDGSFVSYYTFGQTSGTMSGTADLSRLGSEGIVDIPPGQTSGEYVSPILGGKLTLALVNDPQSPKATLQLRSKDIPFTLWNVTTFVPEGKAVIIGGIAAVTTGYSLNSTTDDLRIRKGPGISHEYLTYTFKNPSGELKTAPGLPEGTNIQLLARTTVMEKVQDWNNYWYYVEYKEPVNNILAYKNAWCYGQFITTQNDPEHQITIEYPKNEGSLYLERPGVEITGKVTGSPDSLKGVIKDPYGNAVIKPMDIPLGNDGQFSWELDPSLASFGTNIVHFAAKYPDGKETRLQLTFYLHQGGAMEMAKPVIYLYPTAVTDVTVQVSPAGGVTKSEPAYGTGWTVSAQPDGKITDKATGKQWPYLFWEAAQKEIYKGDEGFMVKTSELSRFFDEKLGYLGLNPKEIKDFKEFWLGILNKGSFYFIHFYSLEEINAMAPLKVQPKPDTIIRVYFDSKPMNNPQPIKPQVLKAGPARSGFTVTEWGGNRY